ncbi:MAG: hypothetical protein JEZ04_09550 [Spirochaetales bacterium]|nr:hypothetical protein [Spirochaetales bacterium]
MIKKLLIIIILLVLISSGLIAQAAGTGWGWQFGTGMSGSLSYFETGVMFPRINETVFINAKLRAMSAITWTNFTNMNTGESVSFHPVVLGGLISVGGGSPMIEDHLKVYGGSDIFIGYSMTPYDSLFYQVDNLFPPNITFGIWGHFGLEFFTSEKNSIFIQSGGGYKSMFVEDKTNPYAVAGSWPGSGFGIEMGSNIYF